MPKPADPLVETIAYALRDCLPQMRALARPRREWHLHLEQDALDRSIMAARIAEHIRLSGFEVTRPPRPGRTHFPHP